MRLDANVRRMIRGRDDGAIDIPKTMLRRIDKECEKRNMTRTRFVIDVIEIWFQEQEERRRRLSADGWEREGTIFEGV